MAETQSKRTGPIVETCIDTDISKYFEAPDNTIASACPVWYECTPCDEGQTRVHTPGEDAWSLLDLFWCSECQRLVPRDPEHVVWEIDSYYCPHSLENVPSSEAMLYYNKSSRVFNCPSCANILSTMASTVKTLKRFVPSLEGEDENSPRYYLTCSYCRWDSLDLNMVESRPEDLINNAVKQEKNLPANVSVPEITKFFETLNTTEQSSSKTTKGNELSTPQRLKEKKWRWNIIDDHLNSQTDLLRNTQVLESNQGRVLFVQDEADTISNESPKPEERTSFMQQVLDPGRQPLHINDLKPSRANLRTKQSIRCRECLEEGRPNILSKPQINPLKGDSSMRTNVGAWFKKDSHAYGMVPRMSVIHAASDNEGQVTLELLITNPTENKMLISFRESTINAEQGRLVNWASGMSLPSGLLSLGAYDELEMIDQQWKSNERGTGLLKNDDPEFIKERCHNKLVVQLQCLLRSPENDDEERQSEIIARMPLDIVVIVCDSEENEDVSTTTDVDHQKYGFGIWIDLVSLIEF